MKDFPAMFTRRWLYSNGHEIVGFCWVFEPEALLNFGVAAFSTNITMGDFGAEMANGRWPKKNRWRKPPAICILLPALCRVVGQDTISMGPRRHYKGSPIIKIVLIKALANPLKKKHFILDYDYLTTYFSQDLSLKSGSKSWGSW